jgi:hypothetical protein
MPCQLFEKATTSCLPVTSRLVHFRAGREQDDLVETGRQFCKAPRQIDHRAGQHAAEQVIEAGDLRLDGGNDPRMRMPEDGTHLA